jgi:alpha-L-fucosidase 2
MLFNLSEVRQRPILLVMAAFVLGLAGDSSCVAAEVKPVLGPASSSNLAIAAPIERWDEAIPLGNGLLGGLLWGGGQQLKLSLDRGDLWDLRTPETILRKDWNYATMQQLAAAKNQDKMAELFDAPYNMPYPTKIPAGRLEISLDKSQSAKMFRLDLASAVGRVDLEKSGQVEAFFSAEGPAGPVAMLRVGGPEPQWRIVAPDSVKQLGYPAAAHGGEGQLRWTLQEAALGLKYAVVAGSRRVGDTTQIALAITSTRDDPDPLSLGRQRVRAALQSGWTKILEPHAAWWQRFWAASGVRVPDKAVQQHYDLVQYYYGAASRVGSPPIPLQGVWTADEGTLPPWHGDYHHDLNTQLTYWAYLTSGRFEEGDAFLKFMWDLLPVHRRFAKEFYAAPGAAVPGVMALDGKPMGGWGQYSLSPTMGAWVAQSFYLHWRYTMDAEFLAQRAYPYCDAIGLCLETLLQPAADGKLRLPLSTSPEIHDNSMRAWLAPNSNFDLALVRWLYEALVEMARAKGDATAAARWQKLLDRLDPLAVEGQAGPLRLARNESLAESHRHLSHLMAIHPLGTLNVEGSDRDRNVIAASLARFERLGTQAWCGYSFSWMACMAARAAQPETAAKYLDIYLKAFISPNGFHLNGDYKRLGHSGMSYRPFTLEGNFAAGQAVHEMLLQSWGGVLRIFPATPARWADVSFDYLRAEGGYRVSAIREGGRTKWISIRAARDGQLRLRDPFAGRPVSWNRSDVVRSKGDYVVTLRAGETLEGKPAAQ